jgi:hypothetical protein
MLTAEPFRARIEVDYGTGLRAVVGGPDPALLQAEVARRLPDGGLAAPRLRERRSFDGAIARLLDSRLFGAAVEAFHQQLGAPLVEGLARFQELRRAARQTLDDPATPEVTVVLLEPYPLSSTQRIDVVLHVGELSETFAFSQTILLEMGETAAVVRRGAIEEVVCEAAALTASFTAEDLAPPLWRGEAPSVSVHLHVAPPVVVPFSHADEEVPDLPGPRRTTERPPVPAPEGGAALRA